MGKVKELNVQEQNISLLSTQGMVSGCITEIAVLKNPLEFKDVVKNRLRGRSTLSFVGLSEKLHNSELKWGDSVPLLSNAGKNSFPMSLARFIETFNAVGERLNQVAIHMMCILTEEGEAVSILLKEVNHE